jgi:hypothetical protein
MILTVRLLPKEAKALTEMCRRFRTPTPNTCSGAPTT